MALTLNPDVLDRSKSAVDRTPLTTQLADHIRQGLADHDLEPGEFLPGEEEIAKAVQLSRPTVRDALAKLVQEGLIIKRKGVGTMVAIPPSVRYREVGRYFHEAEALRAGEHLPRAFLADHGATLDDYELRGVEITKEHATAQDVEYLRVRKDSPILRRRMVECIGGKPIQIHRQAIPHRLAKGTGLEQGVSVDGIQAELWAAGIEPTHWREWIQSREPNRTELDLLEIGSGPVDVWTRVFVIAADPYATNLSSGDIELKPVQVSRIITPSARNTLYLEGRLTRPPNGH